MSFVTLKKDDLLKVADTFGVDTEDDWNRAQIISALGVDGVTWDMYQQSLSVPPVPLPKSNSTASVFSQGDTVLLKMDRENGTYSVRGYKFTRDNPFLPVDEENANYILENVNGFHIASPREAEAFYS